VVYIYIYQLNCKDCNKKYIGQTDHSFCTRFREHFNDFKHGNGYSKFAQHLLGNKHSIVPIDEIMQILHTVKKRKMMDTLERFHTYIKRPN
jgi:GIY-YIG catalytic domain.